MNDEKRTAAAIYALSAMRFVVPFMPNDLRPFRILADLIGSNGDLSSIDVDKARMDISEMLDRAKNAHQAIGNDGLIQAAINGLLSVECAISDFPDDEKALQLRDASRQMFKAVIP